MRVAARRRPIVRVAVAALALALATVVSSAAAGTATPERQPSLDRMVRFLQESQRPSGGFAPAGKTPSQSVSAWVALALAAAGVNPQDQATCGIDAFAFLEGHFREGFRDELAWPEIATTALERELLVVGAAGTDPHAFAGFDLVAEILARQLPDGSFPYVPGGRGEVNNTVFAMLALTPVAEPAAQAAVQSGAEWLATQQNEDGGWSWQVKGAPSEVDLTGAAIEALNAAARPHTEAEEGALAYLRTAQRPDGGFAEFPATELESNVASTAWGVQGIWAAGENPETWLTGSGESSEEPLDYMESMQQPDGHARWKASSDLNGIWMTAYVAPAFAGQSLPIPTAPRAVPVAGAVPPASLPPSCTEPLASAGAPTPGAEAPQPGEGVISGGGGDGAPFFSRPRPQSQGRTPGGARLLDDGGDRPRDHSRIRRGANAKQPTGTELAEPSEASDEEVSKVAGAVGGDDGDSSRGGGNGGREAASSGAPGKAGREVSGTLIGSPRAGDGELAFGAPGLHSAGEGGRPDSWIAVAIGVAALLLALVGARWERRGQTVLP